MDPPDIKGWKKLINVILLKLTSENLVYQDQFGVWKLLFVLIL